MHFRRVSRRGLVAAIAGAVLVGTAGVAFASQITQPNTSPFAIPGDVSATVGNPVAVDVVATGFNDNQNVFIEQCDGKDPADPTWSVANDCDFGLSPSPAIAVGNNGSAVASFVGDGNNFQAFKNGKFEAQNKFNCIGPDDPPTNNGLTDWTTCRIRVDVNPSGPPSGFQTFLTITLPDNVNDATTTSSTSSTSSTSTSTTTVQQSPKCGMGAGVAVAGKPNKNIGTIKLAPGVTGTTATKAVNLKLSGTLDNCTGFSGFPNQKLPINGGSFTASIQVPAGSMCPSTFVPGTPLKGKLTIKWTGTNPKNGKPAAATATDTFKVATNFSQTSASPLSFQLLTGPFTGTKSSFAGHSATMTFVVDQTGAQISTACAVKGGLKTLNFTGVQGPSMIVIN